MQAHFLCVFVANLKIDAIDAFFSGKFLRQKSCYPESFCFLWLWCCFCWYRFHISSSVRSLICCWNTRMIVPYHSCWYLGWFFNWSSPKAPKWKLAHQSHFLYRFDASSRIRSTTIRLKGGAQENFFWNQFLVRF